MTSCPDLCPAPHMLTEKSPHPPVWASPLPPPRKEVREVGSCNPRSLPFSLEYTLTLDMAGLPFPPTSRRWGWAEPREPHPSLASTQGMVCPPCPPLAFLGMGPESTRPGSGGARLSSSRLAPAGPRPSLRNPFDAKLPMWKPDLLSDMGRQITNSRGTASGSPRTLPTAPAGSSSGQRAAALTRPSGPILKLGHRVSDPQETQENSYGGGIAHLQPLSPSHPLRGASQEGPSCAGTLTLEALRAVPTLRGWSLQPRLSSSLPKCGRLTPCSLAVPLGTGTWLLHAEESPASNTSARRGGQRW